MKNYFLFFICVFSLPVLSQNGISIAVNYIQPMVTNFDNETKNYENPVDLYNLKSTVSVQVYRDEHFLFRMGLSYKFLDLILRNVMDSISYSQPSIKDHSLIYYPRTHYFNEDKPDYHNRSNSVGLHLDMNYLFGKSKNHSAGVEVNYYFFEYYKGFYKSTELDKIRKDAIDGSFFAKQNDYIKKSLYLAEQVHLPRNFFTSAIDLQLYYQYNWNISDNFSLGVRASIGTNLYSDWKQFKKYVWAGFGLNIGFLKNEKVRLNRGELRK